MAWLVEEGGTIKGRSVKREAGGGIGGDIENQDPEMPDPEAKKKIRLYDQMRLEALRLERDAQRALLENAQIEGDKLKKEASILDVQLEIMKIDLAIRKEEALKVGVVFEMADAGIAIKTLPFFSSCVFFLFVCCSSNKLSFSLEFLYFLEHS